MTTATTPKVVFDPMTDALFQKVDFKASGPEQIEIIGSPIRQMLVTGGEQGGKSICAGKVWLRRWQTQDLPDNPGDGTGEWGSVPLLYWLVGSAYSETRREFSYIRDDLMRMGLPVDASKRVDPGHIELKKPDQPVAQLRIETKSAQDITKLSQEAPHGIIACEASQLDLETYERLQGRIAPKNGWLFMSGTMEKGQPWYPQMAAAWASGVDNRKSFELPSWTNTALYPGGRNDPKILELERNSSDDFFMERIAGRPVPPRGLVFHEFRPDIHIRDVQWRGPNELVYVWSDPGYGGDSAYAVNVAHIVTLTAPNGSTYQQVQVFDQIYVRGLITDQVTFLCKTDYWWASPKVLVLDPHYMDQHHANKSVAEIWLERTGLQAMPLDKVEINAGSERLKSFLKPDPITGIPKIVFSPKCTGILSEFGAAPHPIEGKYKGQMLPYRWNLDSAGNQIGKVPNDRWNHAVKAVIYGLVQKFGYTMRQGSKKIGVKRF